MLPRLTWPTCIKHASLGACTYVSTSRLKSYVLQGQQNVSILLVSLEPVCCKKKQKTVPDQLLVCGIGDP